MKISILGCGWFGLPLAAHLAERGHQVNGSTTTPSRLQRLLNAKIIPFLLDIASIPAEELNSTPFFDCETLVITIPPSVPGNYLDMMRAIAAAADARGIAKLVFTSSTSVYGDASRRVNEFSTPQPSRPSAKLLVAAENILRANNDRNILIIRPGGLVGPGRSPAAFFEGRTSIPNGSAPVNLVHLDDIVGIATLLVEGPYRNLTVNAVTPHHPPKASFYTMAARSAGKLPPDFVMDIAGGKIVNSKYLSQLLQYEFVVDHWFKWLANTDEL